MSDEMAVSAKFSPYEILKPPLLKVSPRDYPPENTYQYNEDLDLYTRSADTADREAVITCGGLLRYNITVGKKGMMGRSYDFTPCFRYLPPVFDGSDLNVAALNTPVSDEYISSELQTDKEYYNARPEFLTGIRWMGIDCLAAANPHIVDAGTNGIGRTVNNILSAGMVPAGIGRQKAPLFKVNGILVGVLSYTLQCRHVDHYISKKGAEVLIGIMKPRVVQEEIKALRERGADFILVYLNTEASLEEVTGAARTAAAKKIAEAGADYVIGVGKTLVGKYWHYKTSDGRSVPLAPAISNLIGAKAPKVNVASAVLRITVKKDADGHITLKDVCFPLCHISDKYLNPVVPAVPGLYPFFNREVFETAVALVRVKTEDRIPLVTGPAPLAADADGRTRLSCAGYVMTFDRSALTGEDLARTIKAFCASPENENHRVVVLTADLPGAGEEAYRGLARDIADCSVGLLCCTGTLSRILAEEAARSRRSAFFEEDMGKFADILIRLLRPEDRLLVLDGPLDGQFEGLLMPMFGKLPRG